jgi:nicotinamide-nucleotide amidase
MRMPILRAWVIGLASCMAGEPAESAAFAGGSAEYVLVVTGGELLEGSISDAHTPFITRTLRPLGLRCVRTLIVDDTAEEMKSTLAEACQRAPLVLVTGGLGPTVNDITREVLSEFTGISLVEHSEVLRELGRRFNQPPQELRDNLRRQARVPSRGSFLPNHRGTAVGLIFDSRPATIVALPGPPHELQAMVTESLVPWVRQRLGLTDLGVGITLRFVGIGQSAIDAVLREKVSLPTNVVVTSHFEGSRVDFTFSLPQSNLAAQRQLTDLMAGIQAHLGAQLYATNGASLEEVAVRRLLARAERLTVVEAGGPHLAASLSRNSAARQALAASFAAVSEEDLRRLLGIADADWTGISQPKDRVERLARAARGATQSAWVIAVGQPAASAGDRSVAWVAVGLPGDRWEHWRLLERSNPEAGRTSLVNEVLDRLRRLDP